MEEYKIPKEHQPLPPEHSIPEEFPVSKPQQTGKKKSSARRLMAVMVSSFMVLQVMFSYFVPPTSTPSTDPPGYTEPGLGGPPDVSLGDFLIHGMYSNVDDTYLKEGLQEAAEYFEDFDYVRAALRMQDALYEFRMEQNTHDLDCAAYAFHNSAIVDFDGSAVNGFYFYFTITDVWYETKAGEMESVEALDAYIVSFSQQGDGTHYRIVNILDELSEFMLYGMSYDWDVTVTYLEGVLDEEGNSSKCERTTFTANNISGNTNVDGIYEVWAYERVTGPVGGYAFLNDTQLDSILVYNDDIHDFERDAFSQERLIVMEALTADGRVDLDHATVMNVTGGIGDTTWDDFRNNDALYVLAAKDFVTLKPLVDKGRELTIYDVDYSKPLLPLDMTVALSLRAVVGDAPGGNPGSGNGNQNDDPLAGIVISQFYQDVADGILEASNYFLADDYIRTGAYFVECLSEYGVNMLNAFSDSRDAFEGFYGISLYCDGKTISSVTQNGLSGCYFHFEKGSNWWIGNSGSKTHFTVMQVTITRVEETAEGTRYRVVQFAVGAGANNPTYVPGALVMDHGDGLRYIEGVFDTDGNSADCEITVFSNAFYNTQINLDGKFAISGVRRLRGSLQNGAFMNGTVLYDNIVYDLATNRLDAVSENGERVISISFLTTDGRVDFSNAAVVDNRNVGVDYDAYIDDPALRCLAGNTLLELKYDVESEYYFDLQIHDLDYSKPVFPLDLSDALQFG